MKSEPLTFAKAFRKIQIKTMVKCTLNFFRYDISLKTVFLGFLTLPLAFFFKPPG